MGAKAKNQKTKAYVKRAYNGYVVCLTYGIAMEIPNRGTRIVDNVLRFEKKLDDAIKFKNEYNFNKS